MHTDSKIFLNKDEYEEWISGLGLSWYSCFVDAPARYPAKLDYNETVFEGYRELRGDYHYPDAQAEADAEHFTNFIYHLSSLGFEVMEDVTTLSSDHSEYAIVNINKIIKIAKNWAAKRYKEDLGLQDREYRPEQDT